MFLREVVISDNEPSGQRDEIVSDCDKNSSTVTVTVTSIVFTVTVVNIVFTVSQILLRGQEEPGYLIIVAAKAVAEENIHKSVWKNNELRAKRSWHASLEGMQYFGELVRQSIINRSD